MKLYNRGQRVINLNTPLECRPGKWSAELHEDDAAKLLKMFPRDLTSNADVVTAEKKEIERLQEELKKEQEANAELLKQVEGLQNLLNTTLTPGGSQLPQDLPAGTTPATVATQKNTPEKAPAAKPAVRR